MVAALLNICTQEELMEGSEGSAAASTAPANRDLAERRQVIKNKILAVGRMAHFFSLLRCACCASPVKHPTHIIWTTARSQNAYQNLRVSPARPACHLARLRLAPRASRTLSRPSTTRMHPPGPFFYYRSNALTMIRRKSDIENERLPPVDERQPASATSTNPSRSVSPTPRAIPATTTPFKGLKDGKA
jgi:hypothetical protein